MIVFLVSKGSPMDAGSLAGVAILIGVLAYPTLVAASSALRRWRQNRRARKVIGY